MKDALEDKGFLTLTAKIERDRGFSCASYKDRCLKRRIAVRMRARGVHSYDDYASLLDSDGAEYEELLQALTINVTKIFRNPEVYSSIAREVVPWLWECPDPSVRIWSAGCSSGEEPYSLAILLQRYAAAKGDMLKLARFKIIGTDIDKPSLAAAAGGSYAETAFTDAPQQIRAEYFSSGWPAVVRADIKRLAQFHHADLFGGVAPLSPYHLIVCRNVIIYFDRASQDRLFERFHHLLVPGGFLVLGKVETIMGEARSLFTPVDARERVFRKR